MTFTEIPLPDEVPCRLTALKSLPSATLAALSQPSTAALTQMGIGPVRTWLPLPTRSTIAQCPRRIWMAFFRSGTNSERRSPQQDARHRPKNIHWRGSHRTGSASHLDQCDGRIYSAGNGLTRKNNSSWRKIFSRLQDHDLAAGDDFQNDFAARMEWTTKFIQEAQPFFRGSAGSACRDSQFDQEITLD